MAFIFAHAITGFTTAADAAKAGIFSGGTYVFPGGRFGDGELTCLNSAVNIDIAFPAAADKVIVHNAVKWNALPGGTTPHLYLFNNSGSDECARIDVTPAGALRLIDAAGATVVTSTAGIVNAGSWQVMIVEADIGEAAGTVRVWLDNMSTPVIDETGVDLTDGDAGGCDKVRWTQNSSGLHFVISQIFLYDVSGAAPWNAQIGDKRLYPIEAFADGATIDWDADSEGDHYIEVDDALDSGASDEDASFVEATSAALTDQYVMTNLPTDTGGIISVIGIVEAKKTDAGAEHGGLTIRIDHTASTTDAALAALTTDYLEYQAAFDDVPGGSGWTEAQVNALLMGPRIA